MIPPGGSHLENCIMREIFLVTDSLRRGFQAIFVHVDRFEGNLYDWFWLGLLSPSVWGAWIEIFPAQHTRPAMQVALRMGGVD